MTTIRAGAPTETANYLFDTSSPEADDHLGGLEHLLDPPTIRQLPPDLAGSGWRCLDLGAGRGSITSRLAEQVGPNGEVHAVDLDTSQLRSSDRVQVHRHDVREGLPVAGTFDLIHARAILVHLPERRRIFAELLDALAPGGWLVIGEATPRPLEIVTAPDPDSVEVWRRMQHLSHEVVAPQVGMSFPWAHEVAPLMIESGLTDVDAVESASLTTGGDAACRMHGSLNRQAEPALLAAGATRADLDAYRALVMDPRFRVWSYQFVCIRGRKPDQDASAR